MATIGSNAWQLASLAELLALAAVMEEQSVDAYTDLRQRMTDMGRPELADVFDSLVAEEQGHLTKVRDWQSAQGTCSSLVVFPPEQVFDDEAAAKVAPELLSAYRAFSMAVRNEERAFVFWTYVSAHARSDEIKFAAERMAREELVHVALLRSWRRRAFHRERQSFRAVGTSDLAGLERALSRHLRATEGQSSASKADELRAFANNAELRADSIAHQPLVTAPRVEIATQAVLENALALCEFLADCYIDIGDQAVHEAEALRVQNYGAQIIACLEFLRSERYLDRHAS